MIQETVDSLVIMIITIHIYRLKRTRSSRDLLRSRLRIPLQALRNLLTNSKENELPI